MAGRSVVRRLATTPPTARRIIALALHLTYELYLNDGDGAPVFEALTCADEIELLSMMRRMLDERRLRSIEAHRLGELVLALHA